MFFNNANRAYMPQRQQNSSGSGTTQSGQVQRASNLIGRQVRINRGGPDMVAGRLVAIPADYLVLSSKDGIVYVNAAHVKSITETPQSGTSGSRSRSSTYITASSFNSLLSQLRHQFIQINRGGPEKIEGFLAESNSDSLLVVVNRELIRVPMFHIKTINIAGGGKNKKNSSSGNSSSGSGGNNRSGNRSGSAGNQNGNRTGNRSGNRSGNRTGNRSR
ncbi:hypothetical protein COLU111180_20180 [Cohnella lubricantis]|uniref:Spore coat protein B n=1 Tax=Cohnella lubricantis TaxID=2163172 RepID=A0A841TIQ8_9BACL|nr:hypothetical protein [Cohnella lubricantis]MBB6679100.1 hypothetical protein [Cohnella lubricantis]MBP2119658.1 spore coat protein B [Cohnella lubricantis]